MDGILLEIENGASGPRGGSGLPNGGRALLRNLGLLKSWARLKAFKVRLRRGFIGFRNTQVLTQIQRVTACNVSNGEPIICRIAFKPPATISRSQKTADFEGKASVLEAKVRHDPCVVPRAVSIVESMAALVIADHLLRNNNSKIN